MIKKIDLSEQSSFFSSFNESLVILRKIDCSGQSFVSLSNLGLKDLEIDLSGQSEVKFRKIEKDTSGMESIKLN